MALLIQSGLVDSRKDGRWVYYRIQKENPDVAELIQWLKQEFENSALIQADRIRLNEIDSGDKVGDVQKTARIYDS